MNIRRVLYVVVATLAANLGLGLLIDRHPLVGTPVKGAYHG